MISSNKLFSQKLYWLNQLSGELTETNLITDYVRPSIDKGKTKSIAFDLGDELSQIILNFTQNSNFSTYLLLVSAFKLLLHKYTNNEEIIVGSPIYRQVDNNILNNKIVTLRSTISKGVSFKEFLLEVKKTIINAYSHQNYPFDELVQLLKLPTNPNRCPIFDVILLMRNLHDPNDVADIINDLTIEFCLEDNQINGEIKYNDSLFKEETIKAIARHYANILQQVIYNTNVKISNIVLLAESERYQLLKEFNVNIGDYPVEKTINSLFEKQVKQTPDQIAVVFGNTPLTYEQLNKRANKLAKFLQISGLQPGEFVGILKGRDINFLIALLAILKAGGAYVPIDITYPVDRIRYMLSNSEIRILFTDSTFLNNLINLLEDSSHLKSIICLDVKPKDLANVNSPEINIYDQLDFDKLSPNNISENHHGVDPAYMIYTSGSTGLPKGAIIRHGGAINHIYAQFDALEFTEKFNFLQTAPASSDISVWQFLAPILIGGSTVIVETETVCQPEKLFKVIQEEKIAIAELVPVILRELIDYISRLSTEERALPHLKWMMVTGESASVELVNQWLNLYPAIKVVNAYGPTEAADDITQFIIDKPLPANQRTVPIGKPLANLNLYILNRQMQLVPVGVPGEICVSGFGVGVGYWKNPELTKLSFIPNPFPSQKTLPGISTDIIYKTGDLGRWLPDGNIEFLGRIDHQVKIRGFRIELGEIETLLIQHSAVQKTVVVVREETNYKRLVAYVVPSFADRDLVPQLRHFLQERLPEHMIPSAFVFLETLPLTPSGKVDRRALPAPDPVQSQLQETFAAPRTAVEETLAEIWAQVLGLERVGIHDNFFELGGDSILCIQAIAKAHQVQLNLTPKQLFQNQTIAELAKVVATSQTISAEQGLVTGSVTLTPIQHYFFEQNLPEPNHWNEAVLLEMNQAIDPKILEQVVQELLNHHDSLRLRFEQTESSWKQIYTEPGEQVPFSCIDLSSVPDNQRESALEVTATELQSSLNLSQGSLVRVALINLGAEKTSRLLIIIHHIVVDTLSWRILFEDLQTAYQQLSQRKAVNLPAKTTSLKQWSEQLRDYANSAPVQQELDYWMAPNRRNVFRIPVDYPGGANTEASVREVSLALSSAETKALLQDVPAVYRTQINDVLLTALVQTLAQWTGQRSLVVNLEGHGREEIFDNVDISRTVGLFSSIFPVLLDLGEASTPGDALKAIKEQLRHIPNRGIGYGLLRYLSDDSKVIESLRSLPEAEIVFNYLGQFDQTLSESSLFKLAPESTGRQSSLQNHRSHLLSFTSFVVDGQLQLSCAYSEAVHSQSTIEALTQGFLTALRSLINHCQSSEAGGYTPSDFLLTQLTQQQLDGLLSNTPHLEDIYPLSSVQQGMLFHSVYERETGVYFEQMLFKIHGQLNVSALQQAWQKLVDLQPVLRTSFHWENLEQPLQIVHRQVALPWEQHDCQSLPPVEQQQQLEALLQKDHKQGFDLVKAPLLRLTLIQVAEDDYYFIWSNHHLLLDGWSLPLLFKEILTYYEALRQREQITPEVRRPYRDYIAWLQQQNLSKAESFWREMLKGFTTPTPLGTNRAAGSFDQQEASYDKQEIKLSKATTTALQSLARKYQLTLNTLIQGAWALLLNFVSSESDIVFGSTVSGRPPTLVGSESIIGVFINTLPLRTKVDPPEKLPSWLKKLQDQQVEARQYEHTPLVQIRKWSDIPQSLPLFESIIVFQNLPIDPSLSQGITDLEVSQILSVSRNNYPLTLRVVLGAEWTLQMMYDSYRFDATAITQRLGQLETLLGQIIIEPNAKLSELLEILTESDRKQQLFKEQETEKSSLNKLKLTKRKGIRI
ncbi:non-ribosomal peptide synthetase [Nodularia sp. NIES-3585]|uniref:non-ribosomal peptide synthetase n=1 Tax=Nodularia sp. NIES-3585 TaxID=1973477 RepID=UPI000B5CF25E|nr:non-ribosomal peptide synthetase [Nodularia sp. NIES-3585]GAX38387.1 non-ribosomal peptide synthase [Nodularia sp. NIES-3585]